MPKKYKIRADLDLGEIETLFDLFNHEVVKNTSMARLEHLEGKISAEHLKWHLGHAKYLRSIFDKLRPPAKPRSKKDESL